MRTTTNAWHFILSLLLAIPRLCESKANRGRTDRQAEHWMTKMSSGGPDLVFVARGSAVRRAQAGYTSTGVGRSHEERVRMLPLPLADRSLWEREVEGSTSRPTNIFNRMNL